jgi:putative FmdB family regulatory protein
MPTYEYACTTCGKEFELFQSMKDEPLKTCNCGRGGEVRRKVGRGAGLIFKGSGFYETDYKRKPDVAKSSEAPPKTETKTETKSEPKSEPKPAAPSSPTPS